MLSRRSTNGASGQNSTSPEKTVTLPRSATLSGQSNDEESDSRVNVSRNVSAAAKAATTKSDILKSGTSSSAASSREQSSVTSSSVARAQSLVSPARTSGSKVGSDDTKKEKKSKFRTPSFLKKRKEKKETPTKDKP
ncbi:unnamed protein product [Rotaria socialis]|uniref:Uncharacterized protein n=1 Tax=Rotaria socialis TaxID=392032 RepID=A0A818SR46_9BILA|nr:unnamed protein product [Rotaria socialis]